MVFRKTATGWTDSYVPTSLEPIPEISFTQCRQGSDQSFMNWFRISMDWFRKCFIRLCIGCALFLESGRRDQCLRVNA